MWCQTKNVIPSWFEFGGNAPSKTLADLAYYLMIDSQSLTGDDDAGGEDDMDNPLMMLFNDVYRCTDVTGRPLIEPFLRLPSRR